MRLNDAASTPISSWRRTSICDSRSPVEMRWMPRSTSPTGATTKRRSKYQTSAASATTATTVSPSVVCRSIAVVWSTWTSDMPMSTTPSTDCVAGCTWQPALEQLASL